MTAELVDLYLRLSNADEAADSLERQEDDLRQWADREGLTVRHVWKDYGISGYKEVRRDGFDSALRAVTSGEVLTLAVWKLDRLSRRGAGQVGLFLDEVEKVGGRLVFLQDGLDTQMGSSARLPITVLSELARSESANTSLRVKSRKAADRRAGRYLGSAPPLGYAVNADRRLVPNLTTVETYDDGGALTEFDLMRELVRRVMGGESLKAICRDWNDRRIPTRRRGLWRPSTLSVSLRSPTLAGLMTESVEDREGRKTIRAYRHPESGEHVSIMAEDVDPITTVSEQARLLDLMDGRRRRWGRGSQPVRQPKSLLGLLAKCSACRRTLTTFGDSYRCKRSFVDGTDCAAPVCVGVKTLDDAVRRAWSRHLAALEPDSPVLDRIGERWLQKFDPAPLQEREDLEREIADTETRLATADEDYYERGVLDQLRHERVAGGLVKRLDTLRSRLAEMPAPEADLGALLDPELSFPAILAAPVPEARDLLRLALAGVYVTRAARPGLRFDPAARLQFDWVE